MKILYITTIGGTMVFFPRLIQELISQGHTVDIAANITSSPVRDCYYEWGCKVYPLSCSRSPLDKGNLKAIKQIKKIVEENGYDIVHCHTPIAAACTRLACRGLRKKGVKVFYTAHGFHFYKGAPRKNWMIYYPVEKLCAHFTDVLITINQEDYALGQKKLKAKKVVYVPGVGIDLDKFEKSTVDKAEKRKELGIPEDAKVLLSVGELNENKNHETVIRGISDLPVHYMIAGIGSKKASLLSLAESLGMSNRIHLLGYRKDVADLYRAADVFVFPSFREGLSVSLMEAMSCGLPCAVSKIRGNMDLIDENGGSLFDPYSIDSFREAAQKLLNMDLGPMGSRNKNFIKAFSLKTVIEKMLHLYDE